MNDQYGICEHCSKSFTYRIIHNGFNDSSYAYCDTCGGTELISGWANKPEKVLLTIHQCINPEVENYLRPCNCGGHFKANASPRCPYCWKELSATFATKWIEANAPGTAKGWRWQQNWTGLYCIIIENKTLKEPWIKN